MRASTPCERRALPTRGRQAARPRPSPAPQEDHPAASRARILAAALASLAEQGGYAGMIEVEIMSSRDGWRRDPDDVLQVIKARFRSNV